MITVKYKGVDITDKVSIFSCVHDMYAENQTDTLRIVFNDGDHLWDSWGPAVNDEISVEYGAIKTGTMFVSKLKPSNGAFEIIATSALNSCKEKKSKAWQKVKFLDMISEIAGNHDLSYATYEIPDVTYEYILQKNENDFSFLSKRCILEGCAFLIYDKKLVVYSQSYMESLTTDLTINMDIDSDYQYNDHSGSLYGSCRIEQGKYKGVYNAQNGSESVFIPELIFPINSNQEAVRYAQNSLREANKNAYTGYVYSEILTEYAAASMAKLKTERASSWNGDVFLTHVRNDYGRGMSKIFFRKPLDGY